MGRARRLLLGAAALMAVVVLGGCEVKAELVLRHDGSGTFSYAFGIEKTTLAQMDPGADPLGDMRRRAGTMPLEVTVEDYETDTLKGVRATFEFADTEDLRRKLAESNAADSGTEESAFVFDVLGLDETEDGWKLSATAGQTERAGEELPFDPEEIDKLLDASFVATLPGKPVNHNAEKASRSGDGTTFTWDLLAGAGNLDLSAETSTRGGSGFPVVAVAIPALLVAGGISLAVRLRARRSQPASPANP